MRGTLPRLLTVLSILLATLVACAGGDSSPTRHEFTRKSMGVPFRIVLYAETAKTAKTAADAAFTRVEALNSCFSDYDPESEISRLGQSAGDGNWHAISSELYEVLERARFLNRVSEGAFDVTVGPVVGLWRKSRKTKALPTEASLSRAKSLVGMEQIELRKEPRGIRLRTKGMRLDFGGIAKGYAVDAALRVLRDHGIRSALVDGGGDLAVSASPPGKKGWRIGIAPLDADATPSRYLLLEHRAVATSGDAYQFVEIEGKRYSHICDPKTGLGLQTRSAVTVVAETCTIADSLATSVSVLGVNRGSALVDKIPGAAALILEVHDGRRTTHESKRFRTLREIRLGAEASSR